MEFRFHPGINILCGRNAEDVILALAGMTLCFPDLRDHAHLLDGRRLPAGVAGASDLLQKKLREAIDRKDDRPLFVYDFLERLDEAVDLQPVFEALLATQRQMIIAVPQYYNIKALEEMPYETAIHTL